MGHEIGAEVAFLIMGPRSRHGEELPPLVAAAMKEADAIVAPTTFSVNHTNARAEASKAGARRIFMPDACEEVFLDGSLGEPDEDLGERIVAWIVVRESAEVSIQELTDRVAGLLAPHKRPREVRFLEELPRNEMGKVKKPALRASSAHVGRQV